MLIIGDVARKKVIPNYNVECIEIIHLSSQLEFLKLLFNLENETPINKNNITLVYKINNKVYRFHDATAYLPLMNLLDLTVSKNNNLKICPYDIQVAIDYSKLKFTFKNVNEWEKCIKFYSIVSHLYLKNLDISNIQKLNKISNTLTGFNISDNRCIKKPYKLKSFNNYTLRSICSLITLNKKGTALEELLLNKNDIKLYLSESQWRKINHSQKLNAIYELITAVAINDGMHLYYEEYNILPIDIKLFFNEAFMQVVSSNLNHWFINYAIEYYMRIKAKFTTNTEMRESIIGAFKYDVFDLHQGKNNLYEYLDGEK